MGAGDARQGGEILIVNAWVETEPAVHAFMVGALRDLLAGKTAIYSRRINADGSTRMVRLPVDESLSSRAGRRAPASTPDLSGVVP